MTEAIEPQPAIVAPAALTRFSETSPSSEQSTHPKYRPDVDGLRAIAVLAVVGFHAAPGKIHGGFIGVDIFFVISGFLISSIILKALESNRFSFSEFYSRRIKRLFPTLLVVLTTCLGVGYFLLTDDELKQLSKHIAAGAGFVSNFALWSESGYFDQAVEFKPLLHLWSLGIEEQFYILWPMLLWLACKRNVSYLALILTLGLISLAINVQQTSVDPAATFYLPFSRFWELLVGAMVGVVISRSVQSLDARRNSGFFASAVGMILIAAGLLMVDKSRAFPGWWALFPTAGTALVIWAGPHAWFNRIVLSNRILVWFGLISFPLYLWHWPLLSFLRILEGSEVAQWKRAIAVTVAIALAGLTYEFIEKSIRHRRGPKVAITLVGLMGVAGIAGASGYLTEGFLGRIGAPRMVNSGDIGHLAFFSYIHGHYFPCTPKEIAQDAGDWNGYLRCFQSKAGDVHDVVLLGDSHAEHLFPGLAEQLPDNNLVFYGKEGPPLPDNKAYSRILEVVLADNNVKTVLITAKWRQALRAYTEDAWKKQLGSLLMSLTSSGKRVFLIEDVPAFSFIPSRCKYEGRFGVANLCNEPDQLPDAYNVQVFEAEARSTRDVVVIATHDVFCRRGACSMAKDDVLLYRDDNHLNVAGSSLVASAIVARMRGR